MLVFLPANSQDCFCFFADQIMLFRILFSPQRFVLFQIYSMFTYSVSLLWHIVGEGWTLVGYYGDKTGCGQWPCAKKSAGLTDMFTWKPPTVCERLPVCLLCFSSFSQINSTLWRLIGRKYKTTYCQNKNNKWLFMTRFNL